VAGLAVWVIATMCSDFWHRVAEMPLLAELATGAGRLDLWPPMVVRIAGQHMYLWRAVDHEGGFQYDADMAGRVACDSASLCGRSLSLPE
jgi:hypothetical protein